VLRPGTPRPLTQAAHSHFRRFGQEFLDGGQQPLRVQWILHQHALSSFRRGKLDAPKQRPAVFDGQPQDEQQLMPAAKR
jgi:hypothetical protein